MEQPTAGRGEARPARGGSGEQAALPVYGALDLGTNNCRLLLAQRNVNATGPDGAFRVVNSFSRIVRLGEGLGRTGNLEDAAMDRTIDALKVCAGRMARFDVARARCVTTAACRRAGNGAHFLDRVLKETGIRLDVISGEEEASLAVKGCASLLEPGHEYGLVIDIGGGSTELIWLDLRGGEPRIAGSSSLPFGVVTFAEEYGGDYVSAEVYRQMVDAAAEHLKPFEAEHQVRRHVERGGVQMLGTSGTVTTLAACHQGLERYDRRRVDGAWIMREDVVLLSAKLASMTCDERAANPCIGPGRADLVVSGCAIIEAITEIWPCARLRVADRGVREGVLRALMHDDQI
jgi:exopolyphosphatase / guanosine-5'-triphosphate,3'-diphosphate pyrophosphatase